LRTADGNNLELLLLMQQSCEKEVDFSI
jgi:hypothetical protein